MGDEDGEAHCHPTERPCLSGETDHRRAPPLHRPPNAAAPPLPLLVFMLWPARRCAQLATFKEAVACLEAGSSLVTFPEGTRSKDGRIMAFKKGPFTMAQRAGVSRPYPKQFPFAASPSLHFRRGVLRSSPRR